MPVNADFTGTCDKCGQKEANCAVQFFLLVSDLDTETMTTKSMLFCRRNKCAQSLVPNSPTLEQINPPEDTSDATESAQTTAGGSEQSDPASNESASGSSA